MAKTFEIQKIEPVDPKDPRGPLYEWKLPEGRQITIGVRKKTAIAGGHRHLGKDPSKNPERNFIAKGKVEVTLRFPDGKEEVRILEAGNSISIWPNIWHCFKVLEENTVILEYRMTHFDKDSPDTVRQ